MNVLGLPSEKEYWLRFLGSEKKETYLSLIRSWNKEITNEEAEDMARYLAYKDAERKASQGKSINRRVRWMIQTPVKKPKM